MKEGRREEDQSIDVGDDRLARPSFLPRAHQLPGARDSYAVKTVVDILMFLGFPKVDVNPLGSTEANVGIEKGILSVNLGRTTGRNKHSLEEEADIDGIFLGQKQLLLLIGSLETK